MKSVSFCIILNFGDENMSRWQEWINDKEDIFVSNHFSLRDEHLQPFIDQILKAFLQKN